jgi:DNA polymerase theta
MPNQVQIVGMSATLPNMPDLAKWLDAELYTTEYRPVNLEVKVCLGRQLFSLCALDVLQENGIISKEINYKLHSGIAANDNDPDGLKSLCMETVASNKSAMLFCNSKRRCEVCAVAIADALGTKATSDVSSSILIQPSSSLPRHSNPDSIQRSNSIKLGRMNLMESLAQTQVGLCPTLRQTLPFGVAYHHAGLTLDERKLIEAAFKAGFISVLCTTSTLSAGVNLPAHRVIIRYTSINHRIIAVFRPFIYTTYSFYFRSPHMGDKPLSVATFRQMCGRAGRKGLDSEVALLNIMLRFFAINDTIYC